MTAPNAALAKLPHFADFGTSDLAALLGIFQKRTLPEGTVLFRAGELPKSLHLLVEGAISAGGDEGEVAVASAPCPLGELGVLAGEARALTVVATTKLEVLEASLEDLERLLSTDARIGYLFQRNLLRLAARKIGRDRRRLAEMRANIVSTQKAMKGMRDVLLDAEDNQLHAALFEELDALVEQNRRIHYLVEPSRLVPTHVRLDGVGLRRVAALSNEWLYFDAEGVKLTAGDEVRAVLVLDGAEMPVSGRIERVAGEVMVFLDELIPEYDALLARHLTRAQLLDVVL